MNDTYGSSLREAMKKSMEEPTKPLIFKPLNHQQDCECKLCHREDPLAFFRGLLWLMAGLLLAACLWSIFIEVEQLIKYLWHLL